MDTAPARHTLAELSERFDLELRGDGRREISGIGTLQAAGPETIAFLSNKAYRPLLADTRAGAVIVSPEDAGACPVDCLVSPEPYVSYARVASLFDHRPTGAPGVHASAFVDPSAKLGADVHVGANATVGADCVIGDGCSVGAGCVVAPGCTLGAGTRLVANVTICDGVRIGRRVLVHPGAIIGADGFGFARDGERWQKVPQLGSVVIGDDCEIGANSCIDRGAIGDTVLEEDVRIDNLCQIGHNCRIGAHTAMAAFTGISGSTTIGPGCLFAGRSGAYGHIRIAEGVTVSAMSMVSKSITEPGTTWSGGIPARPIREWQRALAQLNRLDATLRKLRSLTRSDRTTQTDE